MQIGELSKIGLRHPQEFLFLYNLQKTDLRYLQTSGRNLKSKIGHIKKKATIINITRPRALISNKL